MIVCTVLLLTGAYGSLKAQVDYFEDFEASNGGWTADPYGGDMYGPCGNYAYGFNLYSDEPNISLYSPEIGISTGGLITVTFDYLLVNYDNGLALQNSSDWGSIELQWTDDPMGTWNTAATIDNTNHTESDECAGFSTAFTAPAGPVYIRFGGTWEDGDYYFFMDNISLEEALPGCAGAATPGSTLSNVTNACLGVPLYLSLQNTPANSGYSYVWEVSLDGGENWTTAGDALNSPVYEPVQTAPTGYRVFITCNGSTTDTVTSEPVFVGMNAFADCYCVPSSGDCSSGANIENVVFGSITNNSTCTGGGYEDHTLSVGPATTEQASTQPISVTVGTTGGTQFVGVWVDANQSGSFEIEEFTYLGSGDGTTITSSVEIPLSAMLGTTRVRIVTSSNSIVDDDESCEVPAFGEMEDYLIDISAASPCSGTPAPGGTMSSLDEALCGEAVYFLPENMTPGYGVTYQWEQSTDGGDNWTVITDATEELYQQGVSEITQFRALVTCTESNESAYTDPVTVETTTPSPGLLDFAPSVVCQGEPFAVAMEFFYPDTLVAYKWYSSADGVTFSETSETEPFFVGVGTTPIYYYGEASCISGGDAYASDTIYIETGGGFPETFDDAAIVFDFTPCGWDISETYVLGSMATAYTGETPGSAMMNFFNANEGEILEMQTHNFTPVSSNTQLRFDYAYATYEDEIDTLEILFSIDNGANFYVMHTYYGGVDGDLTTMPPSEESAFPYNASDWGTKYLMLIPGTTTLMFRGRSAYGNNLFLDNIDLCEGVTPVLSLVAPTNICYKSEATFLADGLNLGSAPVFTWRRNGGEIADLETSEYVTSDISVYASENISVTVSNIDIACPTSTSLTDAVDIQAVPTPNPVVAASGPKIFCDGGSVTLTNAPNAASSMLEFAWTDAGDNVVDNTPSYTADVSGTYTLAVTDPNTGCVRRSTPQVVNVKPMPIVNADTLGPTSFCPGGFVTLSTMEEPNYVIRWRKGTTNVSTSGVYNAKTAGVYSAKVTLNGCSVISPDIVVLGPKATDATVVESGPTTFCSGGAVTLDAVNNPDYTYQWIQGSTPTETESSLVVTSSGVYKVQVSNAGCPAKTSRTVKVTVNPTPAALITKTAQSATSVSLRGNNGTGYAYQWMLNGDPIPGETDKLFTASLDGSYTLELTRNGCIDTSDAYVISGLDMPSGRTMVSATFEGKSINIYPNPSEGIFNIGSDEPVDVLVKDMQGRVVRDVRNAIQIDLTGNAAGMYMMMILDKGGKLLQVERVMKK